MEICRKRRAIAATSVNFSSSVSDAVESIADVGIERFLAVEAFITPAEDVPAQPGRNRQLRCGVVSVFNECGVVRIGLRREYILFVKLG